ncbi:hypothetical protein AHAS_Ahas05G0095600 [Arachis hypogaea]
MTASSGGHRSPSWTSHAIQSILAVTPQPFIASSIHGFDSINRKEKRMEKPTTTAVTLTVTMGAVMGMGIRMNNGPGARMGMGGYGGIRVCLESPW